jgi:predicted nucleic acid-binding protein
MPYVGVLDACVLHPMRLCDTLLRLADAGMYRAVWSPKILDEMERSVVRRAFPEQAIRNRRRAMEEAFPEAMEIRGPTYATIVPAGIHPKDRHVVETAIAARADIIVTENLKDLPSAPLEVLGIRVNSADAFLAHHANVDGELVLRILAEQASELQYPATSLAELIGSMSSSYPSFIQALQR